MNVAICSLLGLLLSSPGLVGGDEEVDIVAKAAATEWKWDANRTESKHYAKKLGKKYSATVESVDKKLPWSDVNLKISDGKKQVYSAEVHKFTSFLIRNATLYIAEYHRSSTGCAVKAIDLTSGKELWQSPLKGLGPIRHFRYNNRVALELDESGAIVVFGNETSGKYVEFVDPKTGETLAHKRF